MRVILLWPSTATTRRSSTRDCALEPAIVHGAGAAPEADADGESRPGGPLVVRAR
jgi:hypothetical protein